ncbi:MAG: CHAT domain-containing tetratricopeptide repeat protein, partial [Rhodothermales bacterium]|nr:CHAT domain-containing tetratricopeptide repeat protein [Rhodothermales bacterium]
RAVREADAQGHFILRVEALTDLGQAYEDAGQPAEALPVLESALALASEYELNLHVPHVLNTLGKVYEALGEPARAEASYRRAIAATEAHREALGTTEWAATAFAEWQGPYRHLIGLLLRQGHAEEAFLLLDRTRARYLRDLRRLSRSLDGITDAERERLRLIQDRTEALRDSLLREDLAPAERYRLRARLTELEASRPSLSGPPPPEPRLEDVQRALGDREAILVSYFLDTPAHAFVVRPDTFAAVPIPGAGPDSVRALLRQASPLWRPDESTGSSARHAAQFETDALHALYTLLFEPVRPLVPEGGRLIVVPEGPLSQLPFGILLERPADRFQYADAPFLLRRHPITVELAAGLVVPAPAAAGRRSSAAPPPTDLLALGRSTFGGPNASPLRAGQRPPPDLPHVPREVRLLGRLVPNSLTALDGQASEPYLYQHLADARIIHLASHAFVHPQLPLYSHLVLSPDSARHDDGVLYLYELARRSLAADLVVLSACETGLGHHRDGEGMIGLQYGFRAAGAAATLATLWQVEDAAMVQIVERFYTHLRRGLPKDRALQRAQLDYLAAHEEMEASPFFWAAPVLYGDPAPIAWRPDAPRLALWLPLALVLLALGLLLPRLARRPTPAHV